jgi:hypothetical protein
MFKVQFIFAELIDCVKKQLFGDVTHINYICIYLTRLGQINGFETEMNKIKQERDLT